MSSLIAFDIILNCDTFWTTFKQYIWFTIKVVICIFQVYYFHKYISVFFFLQWRDMKNANGQLFRYKKL